MLLSALCLPRVPLAVGDEPPATKPPDTLAACASIGADAERLACYDRLVGYRAHGTAAMQEVPAGPSAISAASARPVDVSGAVALPASSPLPEPSFGSYAAEHPKPPPAARALSARVTAIGKSSSGRTTVALEGGAQWELDETDPLLAVGDVVTIQRAAFGSYLMRTARARTHRVRRVN
jgi:hypothetical protein